MKTREEPHFLKQKNMTTTTKAVLVVDDSADMIFLLKTVLEIGDYEVFTAQSGKEALKILSEINSTDLILLDMQMDEMSGTDFLVILNEKMPDLLKAVPVVFLTGMDKVPKSDAVVFIRKPIGDINEFLKDIQSFIEAGTGHTRYEH